MSVKSMEWAKSNGILDLLPELLQQGFTTLCALLCITTCKMGIVKVGDQKHIKVAVEAGNNIRAATKLEVPFDTQPPAATPLIAIKEPPSPSINLGLHLPSACTQKRCHKHCHQLLFSMKHSCMPVDQCTSINLCGCLDLHPEEKKCQAKEKKAEQQQEKWQKIR